MQTNNLPLVVYDYRVLAWLIYNAMEKVDFTLLAAMSSTGERNPKKALHLVATDPPKAYVDALNTLREQYIKAAWALVMNRGPNAVSWEPHTAVVVDDNGVDLPYWRKQLFPGYKGSRSQKTDGWKTVSQLGLNYVCAPGSKLIYVQYPAYEADDLAGVLVALKRLCQSYLKQTDLDAFDDDRTTVETIANRRLWLYTVDSDWLQLVGRGVTWYNTGPWEPRVRSTSEAIAWTKRRLKRDIRYPEQIVDIKMAQGDKSDDLPPGSPRHLIDLINVHKDWHLRNVSPATYAKLKQAILNLEPNINEKHLQMAKNWFTKKQINPPV